MPGEAYYVNCEGRSTLLVGRTIPWAGTLDYWEWESKLSTTMHSPLPRLRTWEQLLRVPLFWLEFPELLSVQYFTTAAGTEQTTGNVLATYARGHSSDPRDLLKKWAVVACANNPSTVETDTKGSLPASLVELSMTVKPGGSKWEAVSMASRKNGT